MSQSGELVLESGPSDVSPGCQTASATHAGLIESFAWHSEGEQETTEEKVLIFVRSRELQREAEILKVLGNPTRLKIVAGLTTRRSNVKHLWESLGLPQATISQHLSLLKDKGIIKGTKEGVEVHYVVVHPLVQRLLKTLREPDGEGSF